MQRYREKYRIPFGSEVDLTKIPARDEEAYPLDKKEGKKHLEALTQELSDYQKRLFAEQKHRVLIVLQGMDTSGKNGTIRNIFRNVTPQGISVVSFGKPTRVELSHDYLWRVHKETPEQGEITIFDRSHYEDVTAVRVNQLKPESVWRKRFEHLNSFEKLLTDEGTTIIKFLLHISREEQKERLQKRLSDVRKQWKFDESDLIARDKWDEYMEAYNDVLRLTNKPNAPWHVIPSDQKWLRNLIVAEIVIDILKALNLSFPEADFDPTHYDI